jgi:hypothetical protein
MLTILVLVPLFKDRLPSPRLFVPRHVATVPGHGLPPSETVKEKLVQIDDGRGY